MSICEQTTCPRCSFTNDSSRQKCQICHYPLNTSLERDVVSTDNLSNRNAKNKIYSLYKDNQKITRSTSAIGTSLAIASLLIASASLGIVIFNHNATNSSFLTRHKVLNKSGDIKLYDTMANVPNVPVGTYNYGGAICFAALQRDGMMSAIALAHPNFQLRYVEPIHSNPGCTTGIQMLLDRELTVAQNSRPLLEAELKAAKERGFELESVPIAIDGVVFYVNKSVGIKSLTIGQLKDIYTGEITNWQEVGGKNLPIVPISLDPQIDSILRLLMETENTPVIDDDVVIVRDYTTAIRTTANTLGGISYASSAILRGQRSIESIGLAADENTPAVSALLADGSVNLQAFKKSYYPLTRSLSIVFRRDNTPNEQAAVAYVNLLLSQEGQKIVKQAGMVPIYYDW